MSLRQMLGRDVARIHRQLDELLDKPDGLVLFVDRDRAISYAAGFGLSSCQLELVMEALERTARASGAHHMRRRADERREGRSGDRRGSAGPVLRLAPPPAASGHR
jgi:hypothetical protein